MGRFKRWLLVLFGVLVSSAALAGGWQSMMSPGPVTSAHEDVADDCEACHLAFAGVPSEGCLSCHTAIQELLDKKAGYHYSVKDQACTACHTDHRGPDESATLDEALKAFDHDKTGFSLAGAHATVPCAQCHVGPLDAISGACQSCHAEKDPHKGQLGTACEACHSPSGWKDGIKALTDHKVAMDGGHANLTCQDCHAHGDHLESKVGCEECHTEAHGGSHSACADCHQVAGWKPAEFDHGPCTCTLEGKHQTASCLDCHPGFKWTDTPTACSGCHVKDRKHDDLGECSQCHTTMSWKDDRFDHNGRSSSFHLQGEHLKTDCASCHGTPRRVPGTPAATDPPPPGPLDFKGEPTACAGCHQQQGDDAHGDFGACEQCHTTTGFSPSTFDHATTGFPLEGHHDALSCKECHPDKAKGWKTP